MNSNFLRPCTQYRQGLARRLTRQHTKLAAKIRLEDSQVDWLVVDVENGGIRNSSGGGIALSLADPSCRQRHFEVGPRARLRMHRNVATVLLDNVSS